MIQLQEMLDKNQLKAEDVEYDQRHTVVKMKVYDQRTVRLLCSPENTPGCRNLFTNAKSNDTFCQGEMVKGL